MVLPLPLPLPTPPLDDEPLLDYIDRLARRHGLTRKAILRWVTDTPTATTGWKAISLGPDALAVISVLSGQPVDDLAQRQTVLPAVFGDRVRAGAAPLNRLDVRSTCTPCLDERHGSRRLSWDAPYTLVCPTHRLLLGHDHLAPHQGEGYLAAQRELDTLVAAHDPDAMDDAFAMARHLFEWWRHRHGLDDLVTQRLGESTPDFGSHLHMQNIPDAVLLPEIVQVTRILLTAEPDQVRETFETAMPTIIGRTLGHGWWRPLNR